MILITTVTSEETYTFYPDDGTPDVDIATASPRELVEAYAGWTLGDPSWGQACSCR